MEKWYEGIGAEQDVIVGSRIRLRRNIQGKMFPEKLPADQRKKLGSELMNHVSGILSAGGVENHCLHLSEMDDVQKNALLERSVLTKTSLRETEDIALYKVLNAIKELEQGKTVSIDYKKASGKELQDYFTKVLPEWDRDRVHNSDIKKLLQWYNILIAAGFTDFDQLKPTEGDNIDDREKKEEE